MERKHQSEVELSTRGQGRIKKRPPSFTLKSHAHVDGVPPVPLYQRNSDLYNIKYIKAHVPYVIKTK